MVSIKALGWSIDVYVGSHQNHPPIVEPWRRLSDCNATFNRGPSIELLNRNQADKIE